MMKKAFSYSLFVALAIAVLCTLTLVACSKDEPVVTGIYLTDASGARIEDSKELGSVPFGTAFADIIDFADYEMHAVYSDGSDVAVGSAYSVMFTTPSMSGYEPIKSFPGIPPIGNYEILFDYDAYAVRFYFNVVSATREDYSFYIASENRSWEYDEMPPVFTVEYPGAGIEEKVSFYAFPQAAYDTLSESDKESYWLYADTNGAVLLGDSPCAVSPGRYYIYAEIPASDGYEVTYTAIDEDKLCNVYKGKLSYPNELLESLRGYYKYDGQIGVVSCSEIAFVDSGVEGADDALRDKTGRAVRGSYVLDNPDAVVNSGLYDKLAVVFVLDESESDNYVVENIPGKSIFIPITVEPGAVTKPTSVRAENAYYNESGNDKGKGPYPNCPNDYGILKGEEYRIVFDNWDAELMEAKIYCGETVYDPSLPCEVESFADGDSVKYYVSVPLETGDYLVWIALKDSINYYWEGGSGTSDDEPVEYRFSIFEKKAVAKPTVELYNGIAGDTFGKAFVAYDGGAKYLLFNDYDDFAVMCTLNGEWAVPVESVFNGYTRQLEIAADVYGEIAVKIVPDEDYIWTDGTSEPVTLDFEIRKGAFFDFSGEYVSVNLSNDIALPEAEKPEYAKLMGNWFGTSGINGKMASTGMVGYTAAVRFVYTKNDVKEAEYSGTFHNTHGQGAAFYRFDMEFVLASLAGSETRYSGHGDNTGEMHIVDVDSGFLTDKIGEYDNVFFAATAINLTQQISSDKIFYSVNGDGGYTRIKMTGSSVNSDGSGATVVTESEVVMVFDAKGDYVGHKYQSTITTGDNVESFEVEFGNCR